MFITSPATIRLAALGLRPERDERLARVDSDPDLEREPRICLVQLRDRILIDSADRTARFASSSVHDGRAEHADDGVPDELLHDLVSASARGETGSAIGSEDRLHVLGVQALRGARRADEIGEDDGDDLAFLA